MCAIVKWYILHFIKLCSYESEEKPLGSEESNVGEKPLSKNLDHKITIFLEMRLNRCLNLDCDISSIIVQPWPTAEWVETPPGKQKVPVHDLASVEVSLCKTLNP